MKKAVALHVKATAATDPAATARLLSKRLSEVQIPIPSAEEQAKLLKSLLAAEQQIAEATLRLAAASAPDKAIIKAAKIIDATLDMAVEMVPTLPPNTPTLTRKRLRKPFTDIVERIELLKDDIGPLRRPAFTFNPAGFDVIAHVMATALMAQDPRDLSDLPREMGSGIYALFYKGNLPYYRKLRDADVPIYVGSASPGYDSEGAPNDDARSLVARVSEHHASIKSVEDAMANPVTDGNTGEEREGNLRVEDFRYRVLMVTQGWELAAEQYLIRFYKPTWNKETKRPQKAGTLCTGFGKHGDSSSTRANKRSKWDTVHPGRSWAWTIDTKKNDMGTADIENEIEEHLRRHAKHALDIKSLIGAATGHPETDEDEDVDDIDASELDADDNDEEA